MAPGILVFLGYYYYRYYDNYKEGRQSCGRAPGILTTATTTITTFTQSEPTPTRRDGQTRKA